MDRKSWGGGALSAALFSRPEPLPRRLGQNSNNYFARPRLEARKLSIRPSPKLSHASLPPTLTLGSGSFLMVYSKTENALVSDSHVNWFKLSCDIGAAALVIGTRT